MGEFIIILLAVAGFAVALVMKYVNYKWQIAILAALMLTLVASEIFSGSTGNNKGYNKYFIIWLLLMATARIIYILKKKSVKSK
ncbi:MAG: hypothetical protein CRN43_08720 [Candidatus Nephrothrix sp. EaCA]|nr:MAG: hypothetical protein CRN43_08720 [Candidatus Nephrothrix sp. EaCA]